MTAHRGQRATPPRVAELREEMAALNARLDTRLEDFERRLHAIEESPHGRELARVLARACLDTLKPHEPTTGGDKP